MPLLFIDNYRWIWTRNARPYGRLRLQVGLSRCTWYIIVGARIARPLYADCTNKIHLHRFYRSYAPICRWCGRPMFAPTVARLHMNLHTIIFNWFRCCLSHNYRWIWTRNARPYGRLRLQVGLSWCTWYIIVGARIARPCMPIAPIKSTCTDYRRGGPMCPPCQPERKS